MISSAKKVFTFGTKLYNGYSIVTGLFWSFVKIVGFIIAFVFVWYLSAYMHERDVLRTLHEGKEFRLLGSETIKSCEIR